MKTRHLRLAVALTLAIFFIAAASPALGLANRVFVSARSGNNANSCDNVNTPCQTFAGAVLQLNPGGEVIVLDSGGYGPVTITKSLTIEAPPGVLAFIHPPSGDAITINGGPGDIVVVRGLVLNAGTNNGITVGTVGVLHVESCVISGFSNRGLHFNSAGKLLVKDTIVRNNVVGIYVDPLSGIAEASLDHCRVDGNVFGFYCSAGGTATAKGTIRESVASSNSNIALASEERTIGATAELNIEGCLVANNGTGVFASSGTTRLSNSTVTDNDVGAAPGPFGTLLSRSNNTVEGNNLNGSFSGTYSAK